MSKPRGIKVTIGGELVQLSAGAKAGKVAVGIAVGSHAAAAVVTPAKAAKIAAELEAGAKRFRLAAAAGKKQAKPSLLRRIFRRKKG